MVEPLLFGQKVNWARITPKPATILKLHQLQLSKMLILKCSQPKMLILNCSQQKVQEKCQGKMSQWLGHYCEYSLYLWDPENSGSENPSPSFLYFLYRNQSRKRGFYSWLFSLLWHLVLLPSSSTSLESLISVCITSIPI